jgi:hypothetical protein
VAAAIREAMPTEEIDRVWLFAPVRREDREWGTAVVSRRLDDARRAVYTATYVVVVRGRDRGSGKVTVERVGETPTAVVDQVIFGVQERAGEPEPPEEVSPSWWSERDGDEPAA